jgi:hypothetical protein
MLSNEVRPVIEPPVIFMLELDCVAIVPRPRVVLIVDASVFPNKDLANVVNVVRAAVADPV